MSSVNRKRLIITSVISIILVSVLLVGSTYSIFTSESVDENSSVYTTGILDVTYTVSSNNVKFEDATPISDYKSSFIKPYRITITNSGNVPYKFNIMLNNTTATTSIDTNYIMTQVGKLDPIALGSTTNNIIKSDVVVEANSSVDIDVRVYIKEDIPNSEIGKNFSATLSIDGLAVYNDSGVINNDELIANYNPLLSEYVINLYNDGSEIKDVNIGGDSSNPSVSLNATQGIMLDNNGDYRYYGSNPNNYVWYNDELWRIISVGNVKSSEDDIIGETRVKIVKAIKLIDDNKLNIFSWDSSDSTVNSGKGVNDWSKSDLMTELNDIYYNSVSGVCYIGSNNASTSCDFTNTGLDENARDLIDDALYYLGGSSEYEGLYADDYYNFERGTNVYDCSTDDGACPRATTWTGKLGLMYPSDYSYAADLGACKTNSYDYAIDENCYSNNWLLYKDYYQWMISPYTVNSIFVFFVHSSSIIGSVDIDSAVYDRAVIFPVLYLKSNVSIVDGSGTESDPFMLKLF